MISNLQSELYEDKVKEVIIQTLEARSLRFDMRRIERQKRIKKKGLL